MDIFIGCEIIAVAVILHYCIKQPDNLCIKISEIHENNVNLLM